MVSKRTRRHLSLAAIAALSVGAIYVALGVSPEMWVDIEARKAEMPMWRLSVALADTALLFLATSLLIGPLNLLRQRPNPTHNPLRRDVGIWAGMLAIGHVLLGMQIHINDLRIWTLFLWQWPSAAHPLPVQANWFGLANYLGLTVLILLIVLLLVSNNYALRRLGAARWKTVQRLNYLVLLFVGAHGFVYQTIEQRIWPNRLFLGGLLLLVALTQLLGVLRTVQQQRRRKRKTTGPIPAKESVS